MARKVGTGKRQSRRKPRFRAVRRKAYGDCATLHRYEEEIVMAEVARQLGQGCVADWVARDPTRWNPVFLGRTFGRLHQQGKLLRGQRYTTRNVWRVNRRTIFTVPTPEQEANRAKAGAKQHAAAQ